MSITYSNETDTSRYFRFIRRDEQKFDERINFITIYGQNCRVVTEEEGNRPIFSHDNDAAEQLCRRLEQIPITMPDQFWQHTHVWNVPALLYVKGVNVDIRVLRQQLLLGGSLMPIDATRTEHSLVTGFGQAIWDYFCNQVWKQDAYAKSMEYMNGRDTYSKLGSRYFKNDRMNKYNQYTLENLIGEDFYYIFWSRDWIMDKIAVAPGEHTKNFWNRELTNCAAQEATTD